MATTFSSAPHCVPVGSPSTHALIWWVPSLTFACGFQAYAHHFLRSPVVLQFWRTYLHNPALAPNPKSAASVCFLCPQAGHAQAWRRYVNAPRPRQGPSAWLCSLLGVEAGNDFARTCMIWLRHPEYPLRQTWPTQGVSDLPYLLLFRASVRPSLFPSNPRPVLMGVSLQSCRRLSGLCGVSTLG